MEVPLFSGGFPAQRISQRREDANDLFLNSGVVGVGDVDDSRNAEWRRILGDKCREQLGRDQRTSYLRQRTAGNLETNVPSKIFRAIYLFQRLSEEKHKITLLQDHYYDPEANTVLGNPSFRAKIAAGCFGRMPSPALMEGSLSDAQCGSVVRLENIFLSPSWLRVWYVIHNI